MTLIRIFSRQNFMRTGLAVLAVASMAGCTSLKHQLGLDKQPPDEFAVVESPPLVMPPDFTLRPPQNPSQKPAETPVEEQARETVFRLNGGGVQAVASNSGDVQANGMSTGENALLDAAGAHSDNPSIRDQLDQEAMGITKQNRGFADALLFWRSPPKAPDETVDAAAEEKRLQDAEASGQPVTTGITPMAVQRKRSFLESLF